MIPQSATKMSNVQMELLKLYTHNVSERQLHDIRTMLVNYFVSEIDKEMDEIGTAQNWTPATIEAWGHEHLRSKSA
jgi:hypothetical protein